MYNFDHEIPLPENRAIARFLWVDYFRDSVIEAADFDRGRKDSVVIRIRCDREERAVWDRFGGNIAKWRAYIDENAERFTYVLRFLHVFWFERQTFREGAPAEFVNARFKDSALVGRLQEDTKRKLLHLRIQTSCGLMDLVFSGLEIRKACGRISYAVTGGEENPLIFRGEKCARAEVRAEEYGGLPADDMDRFLLIRCMLRDEKPHLQEAARACLGAPEIYELSVYYAAYVLGKAGEVSDVPALIQLLNRVEEKLFADGRRYREFALIRKNIYDALEMIRYRARCQISGEEAKRD